MPRDVSPHKHDEAGAKIAIRGSDSSACLEPQLVTSNQSNSRRQSIPVSLKSLLGELQAMSSDKDAKVDLGSLVCAQVCADLV